MGAPTFIAEVVKAIAWPITLITIVVILRHPLSGLIPLLRELSYKDLKLTFAERVREVTQEAGEMLPSLPTAMQLSPTLPGSANALAEISPRAAIIEAWVPLETAMIDLAVRRKLKLTAKDYQSTTGLTAALVREGILDPKQGRVFNELRALRNRAVHGREFDVTTEAAQEYAGLAWRLVEALKVL